MAGRDGHWKEGWEERRSGFTENRPYSVLRVEYTGTLPDKPKKKRGEVEASSSNSFILELIKCESLSSWFTDVRKDGLKSLGF